MSHDVFISHAAADKAVADAITQTLEEGGVQCWIAPRDIRPGDTWGGSIVKAIESCAVIVIVFSRNSNKSRQVLREVERAVQKDVVVLPFRLDDIEPSGDLEYFLSATHWLDALSKDMNRHYHQLLNTVSSILGKEISERHQVLSEELTEPSLEESPEDILELKEPFQGDESSLSVNTESSNLSETELEDVQVENDELESQSQMEFAAAIDKARDQERPLYDPALLELPSGRDPRRGRGTTEKRTQSENDIQFDQSYKNERRNTQRSVGRKPSPLIWFTGIVVLGIIASMLLKPNLITKIFMTGDDAVSPRSTVNEASSSTESEKELDDSFIENLPEPYKDVMDILERSEDPYAGNTSPATETFTNEQESTYVEPLDSGPSDEELAAINKMKAEEEAREKARQERLAKIAAEKERKLKVLNDLILRSNEGDLTSQLRLFEMYENGEGVDKDIFKATQWLTMAAESGDADSQYKLSQRFDVGLGAERSDLKAFIWLNKAAEADQADAQTELADRYTAGDGVQKSDDIAFEWYFRAAEQNHIKAQKGLAAAYEFGAGTAKDIQLAMIWYKKAADQGDVGAKLYLEKLSEQFAEPEIIDAEDF